MRIWPFGKKTEDRSYTETILSALATAVAGAGAIDPRQTAVAETAAGAYARAFAVAEVSPNVPELRALTSRVLWDIAYNLILGGESLHAISVERGMVMLRQAGSGWDIQGGYDEDTWRYLIQLQGPTQTRMINVPSEAVLHCKYSVDVDRQWAGIGPIHASGTTGKLAGGLEKQLSNEAARQSGYALPAPLEQLDDTKVDKITASLDKMQGKTMMVPSMADGFGDGPSNIRSDWSPQRIGLNPPQTLPPLRQDATVSMLSAAGIPPELFSPNATSASRREAWRQFLHGSVQPLAEVVTVELRNKLHPRASLAFEGLFASDLQGRARAFQSLTAGGMDITAAAAASGILSPEDD